MMCSSWGFSPTAFLNEEHFWFPSVCAFWMVFNVNHWVDEGTGVWGVPRTFRALGVPDQPHVGIPLGSKIRALTLVWTLLRDRCSCHGCDPSPAGLASPAALWTCLSPRVGLVGSALVTPDLPCSGTMGWLWWGRSQRTLGCAAEGIFQPEWLCVVEEPCLDGLWILFFFLIYI